MSDSLFSSASLLQKAQSALMDALFPPRCAGCHRFSRALFCVNCQNGLTPIRPPFCLVCGDALDPEGLSAGLCKICRAHPSSLTIARAHWIFDGPPREAIHRFKYAGKWALGARLAPLLAENLKTDVGLCAFAPEIIVPVPLHPRRQRARGFNQSEILANELAKLCALPTLPILARSRATPPQVGLDSKQRELNVEGAFCVAKDSHKSSLENRRVLLIDDVFTTGSTLRECARALRENGALDVAALTLARQVRPDLRPLFQKPVVMWELLTD